MDVPDVTVRQHRLPAGPRRPGALFFTGDAHAAQGQGELCGVALEISAKATFTFDLIKGTAIEWPRIESPDRVMVVGSAQPMEDAARIAYTELVNGWSTTTASTLDAYQLLTQAGGLYVGNMVDTVYSLVASVAKEHLIAAG